MMYSRLASSDQDSAGASSAICSVANVQTGSGHPCDAHCRFISEAPILMKRLFRIQPIPMLPALQIEPDLKECFFVSIAHHDFASVDGGGMFHVDPPSTETATPRRQLAHGSSIVRPCEQRLSHFSHGSVRSLPWAPRGLKARGSIGPISLS